MVITAPFDVASNVDVRRHKCPSNMQDGETTMAFGIKSPAKQFAARYRGVMMRPMSTAVSKAQYEFKPFVSDPGEIDHNLYGKFLGLLKGALLLLRRRWAWPPRVCASILFPTTGLSERCSLAMTFIKPRACVDASSAVERGAAQHADRNYSVLSARSKSLQSCLKASRCSYSFVPAHMRRHACVSGPPHSVWPLLYVHRAAAAPKCTLPCHSIQRHR